MKIKNHITEVKLQAFCARYFRNQGFLTQDEVPFLFKVADLFCFHELTGECIAVEVKIRNWRKGLSQALVYRMMSDKVYIALYDDYIKHVDLELLSSNSIGLLCVRASGRVDIVLEASLSPQRNSYFASKVVASVFPHSNSLGCLVL